jgi:HEAT repeat protein
MIELICPRCGTILPVEESKIGTRIFVCPSCAHPFETSDSAGTAGSPSTESPKAIPASGSEDKTMAPDASLLYVQQKLQEAKARRDRPAGPAPAEAPELGELSLRRGMLWGGIGVVGALAVGVLAVVLSRGSKPADSETAPSEEIVQPQPDKTSEVTSPASALRDPSPERRIKAAEQLAKLGQHAKSQLVLLRVLSLSEDPKVREAAQKAVTRIEQDLLASLTKDLQDKSSAVRIKSAQELAEMGDNAKAALPSLVEALADDNSAVRLAVVDAMVAIGPEAVLIFGEALRDRNPQVRLTAINALGRMGPDARFVLPELIACLGMDARTKEETLLALTRIGDYAVPYLVQALGREKDKNKQKPQVEALKRMAPSAAPVLKTAMKTATPEAGKAAAEVLHQMESEAPPPAPKYHSGEAGLIQNQLRGWFNATDRSRDFFLDKDELGRAMRGPSAKAYDYTPPGQKPRQFSSRDFRRYPDFAFLSRLDRNNDGKISQNEFEYWAYDFADYLKKDMDERRRIAKAYNRLLERELSEAMRLEREAAVAQMWANYRSGLSLMSAVHRDIAHMEWMQRWMLSRLPRP